MLHIAAEYGEKEVIKILLKHNLGVDAQDIFGMTVYSPNYINISLFTVLS